MSFQHILFDLDGTLTESEEGIRNGFLFALQRMGIQDPDPAVLKKMIGPPLHYSFPTFFGFSEQETEEAVRLFRLYYEDRGALENRLYPGISELLKELVDAGRRCYIVTTKVAHQAVRVAEHFGIRPYLTDLIGSRPDSAEGRKSLLIKELLERNGIRDLSQVLMVGDRLYDIEGARDAGVASAGVLYGYGSRQELEEAGADFFCEDAESISRLVLKNNG